MRVTFCGKIVTVGNNKKDSTMEFHIEIEQEEDGRWIAEVMNLPGVMVYGETAQAAVVKAKALALRVLADQVEAGDEQADSLNSIRFAYA